MSAVSVTCRRTLGRLRNLLSTGLSVAGFLAASAGLFAYRLVEAEGSNQLVTVLWASATAPFLPVLAALLGMAVWSEERRTGRLDDLLSTAVRERDFVLGKVSGVFLALLLSAALSLVLCFGLLAVQAPEALSNVRLVQYVPAVAILALQAALWSATAVAVSAFSRQAFVAASITTGLLVALPRGLWLAAENLAPSGRLAFGEMPLDAHVVDFASGVISSGVIIGYLVLTLLALFVASKVVALARFPGRRGRLFRASTTVAVVLAIVCAVVATRLAVRLDVVFDLPIGAPTVVSPQLQNLLSEASGQVTVTAFVSRKDPSYRPLAHTLRTIKRQSDAAGGPTLTLRFVDPRWDLGAADRLVRLGATESSVVFEKGHRVSVLPLADGFGDGLIATALRRVVLPPQRQDIYWTVGHGESSVESYDTRGLSDIARELVRSGFRNRQLDLLEVRSIPADCALIVVAGARESFSRAELSRLDAYLRGGGRLLVLMGPPGESGVSSLLPSWGIRSLRPSFAGTRTLSGSDVIVSDFAVHPVTEGLADARLVLERPLAFTASAAAQGGTGVDRLAFVSVARVATATVVAAVERGSAMGADLAVRPTRLVAIGDPTFVMNGQLASRANANRDCFLNAVAYLAGTEAVGHAGASAVQLKTGMDRMLRARHALFSVVVLPLAVFVFMSLVVWRRRRRT